MIEKIVHIHSRASYYKRPPQQNGQEMNDEMYQEVEEEDEQYEDEEEENKEFYEKVDTPVNSKNNININFSLTNYLSYS